MLQEFNHTPNSNIDFVGYRFSSNKRQLFRRVLPKQIVANLVAISSENIPEARSILNLISSKHLASPTRNPPRPFHRRGRRLPPPAYGHIAPAALVFLVLFLRNALLKFEFTAALAALLHPLSYLDPKTVSHSTA